MRMYRKILIVGFLLASIFISMQPTTAQERSVFWERWDVVIDNIDTTQNSIDVTEIYDVNFSGTFRYGLRVIADTNLEYITKVMVYENGQSLKESCSGSAGTFCVGNVEEGTSITYNFSNEITDTSQNFEIHYTVFGALRSYEGGDQLWWAAIPSDHYGFAIHRSTITVQMPPGYSPREETDFVEAYGVSSEIFLTGTTIVISATDPIEGDDYLEIRVQYAHDPNARVPDWQAEFDARQSNYDGSNPILELILQLCPFFRVFQH
jgi:hypothetical protein